MAPKPKAPSYVLGVGMTKFIKPRGKVDYTELGFEAGVKAMLDAQINYDDVEQGVACYCYGDSTCGQRVFYQFGMTQIPIYNVNNNCSTGSTGLAMARQFVSSGAADCVLVIARVNHEHSTRNPYSQFQDVYTLDQILDAPMIHAPLTKLQCCPTSDGAAAAVVVSQAFLDARPHLKSQAVLIAGQCMATDAPSLFSRSAIDLMGFEMTQHAVRVAAAEAGIDVARDVQVVELHDCFSANELIVLDALGLAKPGKAHELVRAGDITYGGRYIVNPSGGLISKGHPLGATGIAQCAELVWHLRGWANNRAVKGTRAALQHNLGLGGAVVVTVYKRADGAEAPVADDKDVGRANGLGYNPAVEARGFTKEEVKKVRSRTASSDWALQDTQAKVEARF
ncbi:Non-specific lipid-transfer protein like [Verticillium longisporum]|uniref:Non-specific lipid-transfer protein like n=1 Tax=Verticillium longisporum TaxID=100787 RepID=A0A8I2ZYZ5_VERLO|nr:Non-specific lipid-transfer protein like [Verticillium longisporum]